MAQSSISGSQESLPLSQETYLQLFSLLNVPVSDLMDDELLGKNFSVEDPACDALLNNMNGEAVSMVNCTRQNSVVTPNQENLRDGLISSLPASENWPGEFDFSVSFKDQEPNKHLSWVYSPIKDKLYVKKDAACPVNFSVNTVLPYGSYIRVMAVFSLPEHVSEVVKRCINHSMDELQQGLYEAQHLIRCESSTATYHTDASGRHSVVVPFENPPAGQKYSTYLYKFACFTSCSGGPNRRPFMLIFTLETGGQVIGRRKLHIKVCACPGRDKVTEEAHSSSEETAQKKRSLTDSTQDVLPLPKKSKAGKENLEPDRSYWIEAPDKKCYKFLKKMKIYYMLFQKVKTHPQFKALLSMSSQSSSGDDLESDLEIRLKKKFFEKRNQ